MKLICFGALLLVLAAGVSAEIGENQNLSPRSNRRSLTSRLEAIREIVLARTTRQGTVAVVDAAAPTVARVAIVRFASIAT